MARAKRTDRAAARRRYRATLAEEPDPLDPAPDGEDADEAPQTTRRASRSATAAPTVAATPARGTPAAPQRPSITGAFRSSFRPLDLRGDLKALPRLLRHPAFFVPTIVSGLSVALVPLLGLNAMTSTFYQYFSFSAPLGTSFLAGFFAPRASYLLGALAALASVAFQALAFSRGTFGGFLEIFTDPATGQTLSRDAAAALILNQALFIGVPSGAFFAAAAAWYRRFLNRASPNRRAKQAAASGRRPDGKIPRKNQGRPALARRR